MKPQEKLTKQRFRQVTFWFIAVIGLLLPWLTKVVVQIFYDPKNFFAYVASFYAFLFQPEDPLFLVAFLNGIPFVILALCIRWRLRLQHHMESSVFLPAVTGLIGMTALAFTLNLYVYITVWAKVFGEGVLSPEKQLSLLVVPLYTLVLMPISYVIGWVCGRLFVVHD